MLNIEIQMLNEEAKTPAAQTNGSAGYDLFSVADITVAPMQLQLVSLGFAIAVPYGYEAQIRSRSGLAMKHKVCVLNSPGTIDSDYRGEVQVLLMNFGTEHFVVTKGMRIAQMVFAKAEHAKFCQKTELSITQRTGGFGSTGV